MSAARTFDFAVIGAGTFGAWTAHHLQRQGRRVVLLDAYGPANARASSGGESRVIRMAYGPNEIYTRWSMRSLPMWQELFDRLGRELFYRTGVLWTAPQGHVYTGASRKTLQAAGVRFELLSAADLKKRYPQIALPAGSSGIFEPESGALLARRAVQAVVDDAVRLGTVFLPESVTSPQGRGRLDAVSTRSGDKIRAGVFVFACGPWLPKLFPAVLEGRIRPTRQEVFFFGPPPGDRRFAPPAMPIWIDERDEAYSIPDLEHRGFKIAFDRHGPDFDPDSGRRVVGPASVAVMRKLLALRFPALKDAPVVETRVCQYENTSNGDFLIDRHPDFENVWLVGGGSGHGFKHGPALGEYVADRVTEGGPVEPRFSLATKERLRKRAVF